ncbi:cytokinin dehydrogenase 8-like [Aristolochia californica]|uniref:cytokinin dehydrogenase 8-like n=1 Tax=Aristolochia californica TaxID=171875 RepID=UPI0035D93EB3
MELTSLELHAPAPSDILDFGRTVHQLSPCAVYRPKTAFDVCLLLQIISSSSRYDNLTVAPRGAGHCTHGQAQAPGGIVMDMTSLRRSITVGELSDVASGFFVDVDGGALWVEVLEETLKHGLAPRSWTDYLYLTVGGTLSVGGISGQTFKHGPQICNVLEMDVVTGRGQLITCSARENSQLFYGVLGGLGQFGVITRARIVLQIAPKMVKWVRISYDDFDEFIKDEELLISMEDVDYLEGFIKSNCNSYSRFPSRLVLEPDNSFERDSTYYSIEMAIHYDDEAAVTKTLEKILSPLKCIQQTMHCLDVSYFDFLNRVRADELNKRSKGLWEVPHPWLNLFVPKSRIKQLKNLLFETISKTPRDGPIILYPIPRHKWNKNMSTVLPQDVGDDIFYVVSLLRSVSCTDPSSDSPLLRTVLQQNQKITDIATGKVCDHRKSTTVNPESLSSIEAQPGARDAAGVAFQGRNHTGSNIGAKQYIPYCRDEQEWRVHFDEHWERFWDLKYKFDPLNILTPGQRIFKRKRMEDLLRVGKGTS